MRKLAIVLLLVAGCATPATNFVSNKELGAFFTTPSSWMEVSQKALDQAEFDKIDDVDSQARYDSILWQAAYAPTRVKASEVLQTAPQEVPVAYVRVRSLTAQERDAISLNSLRNLVFPVTSQDAQVIIGSDREISQEGFGGIDLTYQITIGGVPQALRQIALMDSDRTTLYLFVVRCSKTCYAKNRTQIETIADSFTVRGTRG